MTAPPWPAPFSIARRRGGRRARLKDERAKEQLRVTLEQMVARGELLAMEAKRGRVYWLPVAQMEDRLW